MDKTFLQICLDVWRETGLSGNGPTDVTTVTGIERRVVGWVRDAFLDIQQYRDDWPWMLVGFDFTCSPGKSEYTLEELNLTDVERWLLGGSKIYKTSSGKASETDITARTYDYWWEDLSTGVTLPAQPAYLITNPVDNSLILFPEPDDEYTITTRYFKAPQILASDNEIPVMPINAAWREIIKWRALYLYAYHDSNPALLDESHDQYESMITALDNRYGQHISLSVSPVA